MKTNYTDSQLQSAIDGAFSEANHSPLTAIKDSPSWNQTAKIRLLIIKSALAALPEPVDEESMLLNLLAVIHRDGGHYQAEHGTRKAVEDACKEWQRLILIAEKTGLTEPSTVDGMSLRDYFAGQALNGYLASWSDDSDPNFFEPYHAAKTSYAYADAMLAAREVKP